MFTETSKIYEQLGMKYLTMSLLKRKAKDLFFKCFCIFFFKKDEVSAEIDFKKCLLKKPEAFKKDVQNYRILRELDKWKLTMFNLTPQKIKENDEAPK